MMIAPLAIGLTGSDCGVATTPPMEQATTTANTPAANVTTCPVLRNHVSWWSDSASVRATCTIDPAHPSTVLRHRRAARLDCEPSISEVRHPRCAGSPSRMNERGGSIDAVHELPVRQGDKQREHRAEVHDQHRAHHRPLAKGQQQKSGEAGQKQERDERLVQAALAGIAERRVSLSPHEQQPGRPHQQPCASRHPEKHRKAAVRIRRQPSEHE